MISIVVAVLVGSAGKWTPQQVLEQGPAWVKAQGFGMPLDTLWNERAQQGLLGNAVQLPGCSGSFVSKDGLLITNHHCVTSIIQEHSTPEQNLMKDGYLARTAADEKASKSFRIQVPTRFLDVTKDVLDAMPNAPDDLQRFKSTEATQKKLVADCEKKPNTRCVFASFDGGHFFTLTEFTELTDVRLVYAPPTAIGDFGGEIDNWMWPRHTGDFALVRAYRDGKPWQPKYFFPLSTEGVKDGDAVAILGYPGATFRSWLADDIAERQKRWYPAIHSFTAQIQSIINDESAKSAEVLVATSDDLRSILNVKKNAEGQLEGFKRGHLVEVARGNEARVKAFIARTPAHAKALEAYDALQGLVVEKSAQWDRDFVLDQLSRSRTFGWPLMVVRRSIEGAKDDALREPGFQERDLPRLRERHERDQKRYAPQVDRRVSLLLINRALALPAGQRIAPIDAQFAALKDDTAKLKAIDALISRSKVFELETRKKMFDETPAQLAARKDALIDLGLALDLEKRALRDRREVWSGRTMRWMPFWRRAVVAEAKAPVAPDANSTLRVSFGRVKGYAPQEAVTMTSRTTIKGLRAKDSGIEPFDIPERIRAVMNTGKFDAVPVDFLADCDTTGGNSGSPIIDGKGRLVGVNFDRVWENVANDFGYNPEIARNVVADVRYLTWLLTEVEGATDLVAELKGRK